MDRGCDIHPLYSDDEMSSGEEDEELLPENYKFFSARIQESDVLINKLKKINTMTENAFKKFSLGLKKAERATLQTNRKLISKD